jgi:RsiW-degrading membrane proteinase PrsW (M82 family)
MSVMGRADGLPVEGARPTVGRRWAWLLTLLLGVGLFLLVLRALAYTGNPNLLPALILLGAAVVPASFVAFLYGRRLAYDVSSVLLSFTALVGGVVGVVLAGVWEYRTLVRLGSLPTLAVGFAEETAKLIIPVAVLLFVGYRRPANGLLLGVASGAGFAALETMGYAFVTLIETRGDLGTVDGLLLLRGLLSPAAHMAWTGLTAAALWEAAARRWQARALLRFVLVYLVAVGLHTTWDTVHTGVVYIVLACIGLGLLTATTRHLSRIDHRQALAASPHRNCGPLSDLPAAALRRVVGIRRNCRLPGTRCAGRWRVPGRQRGQQCASAPLGRPTLPGALRPTIRPAPGSPEAAGTSRRRTPPGRRRRGPCSAPRPRPFAPRPGPRPPVRRSAERTRRRRTGRPLPARGGDPPAGARGVVTRGLVPRHR